MINIERKISKTGKIMYVITFDEGKFMIELTGKKDLYWHFIPTIFHEEQATQKSVILTKENYFLYELLEELYENIRDYNVFAGEEYSAINKDTKYYELFKKRLKEKVVKNNEEIFSNGVINWPSDDYENDASSLLIEKTDECFVITFVKYLSDLDNFTFSVRFNNNGSRNAPFNLPFFHMYRRLSDYTPELVQIHLEEYLYSQKLVRQKKSQ